MGPGSFAVLNLIRSLLFAGLAFYRTRRRSAIEILALRHQLGVLKRSVKRPRLTNADRGLWVLLSRRWVIVMNERHLRRLLRRFVDEYYHRCRTHLSLDKGSPEPRSVEPPEIGEVIELPVVGGLHHRYTRRAA